MTSPYKYIRKVLTKLSCALVILFFAISAQAADDLRLNRRIEEENREALRYTEHKQPDSSQRFILDYGGWINVRYIGYNETDKDLSTQDEVRYAIWQDYRLWAKMILKPPAGASYENTHSFYIRIKDLYTDSQPKETAGGKDNDGPHLDYAYATLDFRPVWVTAGRAYFSVGQGIAYADVGDGVEMSFKTPKFNLKTFVSQSLPHQDNIDTSVPGYDKHTKRLFYGAECDYLGIPGQNIYGFAVFQRDKSKAEPDDPEHDFKYNSEYYGLGLRGKLRPTVSYWWEIIGEKGKSFIFETNEKENISAWANVFVLAYEPQIYSHPEYHFKYAFASGDKGRVSVTNTENGNAAGKDTNFLYFGYLPTGYALSPQLSNLQFFKGGAEFKPFEKNRLFKDFSLGMDYYRFYKARSTGGIDDDAATEDSSDVGQELDANLSWQIFSDLNFSVEYGYFWPGKAYPIITHDNEQYVSVSTTFTF